MKRTIIALATAATFAAPAAFAEAHVEMTMGEGLTMFESLVSNELDQLDIEADVTNLTLGQLAQIKDIVESDETTSVKKENIEAIIN
ncbi:hypothetical protein [Pontivivens nitratireducens]|uniref:hypothetical protein n=1 Tax=Pontivivens nitratireducens TaxID=2758038 RepID=UPI001639759F|nr:hypothetical protein [Pontibrevibacter nitratireducens]